MSRPSTAPSAKSVHGNSKGLGMSAKENSVDASKSFAKGGIGGNARRRDFAGKSNDFSPKNAVCRQI